MRFGFHQMRIGKSQESLRQGRSLLEYQGNTTALDLSSCCLLDIDPGLPVESSPADEDAPSDPLLK
jgi:hypothetical protein